MSLLRVLLRACRPRQWTKNVLVLTAPIAAGVAFQPRAILQMSVAFIAFALASSGIYLINDTLDVEADRALVSIVGGDLRHLVGRNGEVLDALQELTRLAVLRETGDRSRLMLDIDGFRAQRRVELTAIGAEAATKATESGEPVSLPAMTPFERKIVHDAVAAAGLVSESEGVEPMRYVVVRPA